MKQLILAGLILFLSACSTPVSVVNVQQPTTAANSELFNKPIYLRGDFTLWDADTHYQLKELRSGIFTVKVKFMTPGKVYEFKLADEAWSEGLNCGYKTDGILQLDIPQLADCSTVYNYFSFMPRKKGWYKVTLDYSDRGAPTVMVSKV